MSSRKNGDIRGFFRSAGPSSSQAQSQPASSPPLTLDLSSSPRTPVKSAPRVFSRDEVIKGSDDSDDGSDDSLGSITDALGYRSGPAAHRRDPNVLSTPQAKRIASGIHRSPLTLQPKKHKFDLKALISHSREIERTEESIRKANALIDQAEQNSDNSGESDTENDPKRLEEAAGNLFVGSDDEGGKGDKIRRAFKRSKDDETSSRKHCYFFGQGEPPSSPRKNAFPRKKATGRWKFLSQSGTRRQAFIMGLPYTFLAQGESLPDELFQWILDEVCSEQNAELRRQYVNLTELCGDQTRRLVNDRRLYALLQTVGGPTYAREHSKFKSTAEVRPEYLERNWSPLVTFLQLLERIAPNLQTSAAISAVQLLLRMSMDPVVAGVVYERYVSAMTILVSSLAESRSQWNTACDAICSYIYENIDDLELKVASLLSIPSSTSHLVDLRRRIAAESLFNKPGLGRKPIDRHLSFERIRDRLDAVDFKSTNRVDFDSERLKTLTTLLDIVIDRADFMRPAKTETSSSHISTTQSTTSDAKTRSVPNSEGEAAAEQKFNEEIDILAARVNVIHDRIRDKASRKNVKLSLLGLEKRLKYAVRTRPPPKKDIFALEEAMTREVDDNVPKQRDFMRQWAQKKKAERQNKENGVPEPADLTDGGERHAAKDLRVAVG
ncbi:hypothetical protein E0Z10_g5929 [Xylaria hypoxylon]|uniref:Uncharacterized protein n=1 Tax=Xylaria hypoxylon TaxID=37992 RepID=A0A4Z0YUJ2_9PEZI|nr:hypothetical protein E0Z10_g5929 [Xylaria hypoxylon]